jgi:crossover junction endodeoxyribonuclease RuvC
VITYVGLDLAYTNNGFVCIDEKGSIVYQEVVTCPKSIIFDEERLIFLSEKLSKLIDEYLPEKVFMEGLSFGSKGQSISQMGALHFITRIFLFKLGIKYTVVAPTKLKKFVTGTGQCKKELMLLKTYKKFNIEFSDNNLCDAYCLARMAMET